jgi:uncharacterized protein (TIGR03083 family)
MQLSPRYGTEAVLVLDGSPGAVSAPAIRQRLRLVRTLESFSDEQWLLPSRCEGWTNRDVIVHLDSTNSFWFHSISSGIRGEPTRFLTTFDPVASPAQMVARDDTSPSDVLTSFQSSTDALVSLWSSLDDADWVALAEAPPGHISASAVTHHALWDSWVHERDVLLPLGIDPDEDADEIDRCLRYAAGLGPALARTRGMDGRGVLAVRGAEPEVAFTVDIGDTVVVRSGASSADLTLEGRSVDLLEALSIRRPLDTVVPADHAWMLRGLSTTFDLDAPEP